MIRNYLLVACRNILRNKVFSFINVLGLAIGLSAVFLIYQYVRFQVSYDEFHEQANRLYRVPLEFSGSMASASSMAANHPSVGPAMKADFPEVEDFTRMVRTELFVKSTSLRYQPATGDPLVFNEDRMYLADASFFKLFSYPLIEGTSKDVLSQPKSIAISESMARKYFGDEPATGKLLNLNGELDLKVTGVFKDIPQNSHLKFDALISFSTVGEKFGYDVWAWPEFYNYVLLAPGADPKALEAKFPAFVDKYLGKSMRENNFGVRFFLQPVPDIHLKSNLSMEQDINGNERTVYFLSILAVFILIIAWINYINLSTAKSLERSKEVGLRKAVGASKRQLIVQFFYDACLVNVLALVLAALITALVWSSFEHMVGYDVSSVFTNLTWQQTMLQGIILLGVFLTGVGLVGTYPALLLSSFNPALVLKGKFYKSDKGIFIRKSLVSFQYVLSFLLIAGSITIYRQLTFMQNQDLGYQKDQILVVKAPAVSDSTIFTKIQFFKNELSQLPQVKKIAVSSEVPGDGIEDRNSVRRINQDQSFVTFIMGIDPDFISTYDMKLAAGRTFNENEAFDFHNERDGFYVKTKIMINEMVSEKLGFKTPEEAINEKVVFKYGWGEVEGEIIGVTKNHHQLSLKKSYSPILYVFPQWNGWKYYSVSLKTKDLDKTIADVKTAYSGAFEGGVFDYFFLDDFFNQQYKNDQQFGSVFGIFTALAIFVACLGLLGLSIFSVSQRTKEVGIRKVLGASISRILFLFSKDMIVVLMISYVITAPIIYFAAQSWLENFPFHISIGWLVFVAPLAMLMLITTLTTAFISLKAAVANPVKALRQD